jgi:hypothetical protein
MSLVVCGHAPHVQAAFKQLRERVPVTLKSVYEKLQNIEPIVSARLVNYVGGRCQNLITELGGTCQSLLPGYRLRIIDGNHLAATAKRLKVTRGHSAGPLPGQSLAVLDPALQLITNVVPCEDGHAQERSLLDQVLPLVRAQDVWVADRNFCTVDFLLGITERDACFVIRRHGHMTIEPQGDVGPEIETETGWVSERPVWVCRDDQRLLEVRLVCVRLKKPTDDGALAIEILTNLSVEVADAQKIAFIYLKRWKLREHSMNLRWR